MLIQNPVTAGNSERDDPFFFFFLSIGTRTADGIVLKKLIDSERKDIMSPSQHRIGRTNGFLFILSTG